MIVKSFILEIYKCNHVSLTKLVLDVDKLVIMNLICPSFEHNLQQIVDK